MDAKETLKKIATFLNGDDTKQVKLEEVKTEKGVVLEANSFEVGESVFLVLSDGEKTALPEGEYILEDGRVLVADEAGIILSIGEKAEEEEVQPEEEQTMEADSTAKKVVESVTKETHFSSEQKTELAAIIKEVVKETITELAAEVKDAPIIDKTEELSAVAEENKVKPFKASPEKKTEAGKLKFKIAPNRRKSTHDIITEQLWGRKN